MLVQRSNGVTMSAKIEAVKNLAAVRAVELYIKTLADELTEEEMRGLDGTCHMHAALAMKNDLAIAVFGRFDCSTNSALIAKLVADSKRDRGSA